MTDHSQDPTHAMTATYLEKIEPPAEPVLSREQELEQANAGLLVELSEAAAKILTLQADINLALDALREISAGASCTMATIAGDPA